MRGGSPLAAEEDPDRWERSGSDPGGSDAGQHQAGGEEQGSAKRKSLYLFVTRKFNKVRELYVRL